MSTAIEDSAADIALLSLKRRKDDVIVRKQARHKHARQRFRCAHCFLADPGALPNTQSGFVSHDGRAVALLMRSAIRTRLFHRNPLGIKKRPESKRRQGQTMKAVL